MMSYPTFLGMPYPTIRKEEEEKTTKLKDLKRLEIKDTIGDVPPRGKLGTYAEWITPGILYVVVQGNPAEALCYPHESPKYFSREYVTLAKNIEAAMFQLNVFETTHLPPIEAEFKVVMEETKAAYEVKMKADHEKRVAEQVAYEASLKAVRAQKLPRKHAKDATR